MVILARRRQDLNSTQSKMFYSLALLRSSDSYKNKADNYVQMVHKDVVHHSKFYYVFL